MEIQQSVLDEIVAHAREDKPNECCGLIGGTDDVATTAYRTRNEFASPMRFNIHPSDLFRVIEKEIPDSGEELLALYHSHPVSEARPSQTDINLAENWPGTVWLICSLADPDEPVVRGFLIDGTDVEELELVVR